MFRAIVEEIGRRGAPPRPRRPPLGRAVADAFVEGGFRAFFEFIAADPRTFAFLRRNLGTIRERFGDAVLPAGLGSSRTTCARRSPAATCPPRRRRLPRARDARGRPRARPGARRARRRRTSRAPPRSRPRCSRAASAPCRARTPRRPGSGLELADAQRLFSPEGAYLNTASYGLPPRPAWEALQAAQDEWRHGRTGFDGWDESVGRSRAAWARLRGVAEADVAVGPQVSPFAGLVAAALEPGAQVLAARGGLHVDPVPAARAGGARRAGAARAAGVARRGGRRATPTSSPSARCSPPTGGSPTSTRSRRRPRTTARACCSTPRRRAGGCRWTPRASTTWCARATSGCWRRAGRRSCTPARRRASG